MISNPDIAVQGSNTLRAGGQRLSQNIGAPGFPARGFNAGPVPKGFTFTPWQLFPWKAANL